MSVLFIAEDCPYPLDNGGRLRTFHLLSRLSERHEITLIAPSVEGLDLTDPFCGKLKRTIAVPPARWHALRSLCALFSPLPYIVHKFGNSAMNDAVRNLLASERFDLLHCDSSLVAQAIPAGAVLPRVLNAHNVEALVWERYANEERRPWMVPLLRLQLAKVSAYESLLPTLFDHCVTVSEQDRRRCCRATTATPTQSAWFQMAWTWIITHRCPTLLRPLAFVGSLDYRPNKDAVRWFIEAIWPGIREEIPQARMLLIGRRPPRWMIGECLRAGISLCSDVPDTRPYLAETSVVVVPLRIGGGTRLKILEAMAAGRCVVSTSVGAERLDVRDGHDLVIADTPLHFTRQVISLLRDPARWQALASAGRKLVEARYGWDEAALHMEAIWSKATTHADHAGAAV